MESKTTEKQTPTQIRDTLMDKSVSVETNVSKNLTSDLLEIIDMYRSNKIDTNKILNVYDKNLLPLICNLQFNKSLIEFPFLFNTQMLTYRIESFINKLNEDLGYNFTNTMDYFSLKNFITLYLNDKKFTPDISKKNKTFIYKILNNIKELEIGNKFNSFYL